RQAFADSAIRQRRATTTFARRATLERPVPSADRCATRGTTMTTSRTCAAMAGLVYAGIAYGHHGVANFDLNRDIELEGVITNVEFINPHSWLYFDVTGPNGEVTSWRCEMRGGTVLRRSGWTEDMFPAGTP